MTTEMKNHKEHEHVMSRATNMWELVQKMTIMQAFPPHGPHEICTDNEIAENSPPL